MSELNKLVINNVKSDINNNPALVRIEVEKTDLVRLINMSEKCLRLEKVNTKLNNSIKDTIEALKQECYVNNRISEEMFKAIVEKLDAIHLCQGYLIPVEHIDD